MSRFSAAALTVVLTCITLQAYAQTTASADPYSNNADAGKTQFPLAALAGKDSGAITTAPQPPSTRAHSIRRNGSTARHTISRPIHPYGIQ